MGMGIMKIGLFGGTFDPIHNGHIHLANEVLIQENLDQIVFIPAGDPWMKSDIKITNSNIRKHMIDISIAGNPKFLSSDIELSRCGPTYTLDTLEELTHRNTKNDQFFLILGTDAMKSFHLWKNPKRILELTKIILADRNSEISPIFLEELSQITDLSGKIIYLKSEMLDISSTDIRRKILAGESIHSLVPKQVNEFISSSKNFK